MSALHPFARDALAGQAHLRILQTSDLHAHLLSYDYLADAPMDPPRGLAQLCGQIETFRSGAGNSLLVDTGDTLQGTPLADYAAQPNGAGRWRPHPVIVAMNAVGFDAAAPGNHDFDYGVAFHAAARACAGFPLVCANIVAADRPEATLMAPFVILHRTLATGDGRRRPIRIGLIGFVPEQGPTWEQDRFGGRYRTTPILSAARRWLPKMRAAGADLVLALSHAGIGQDAATGHEDASLRLAQLGGVDAVLAGHSHRTFPGPGFGHDAGIDPEAGTLYGVPVSMPGFNGSHLGVIDLLLEHGPRGWRVAGHMAAAEPASRRRAAGDLHRRVQRVVAADHSATLTFIRRPVGRTETALETYFAEAAGSAAICLIADAQRWGLARHMRDHPAAGLPILSAAAPFRSGGFAGPGAYTDIPAGALSRRNLAELYPYPNTLQGLLLTGTELVDWLERSAARFGLISPGTRDTPLLTEDAAGYDFDVIDGLSYAIDLAVPARFTPGGAANGDGPGRIRDLRHAGRPVQAADRFLLATNNYRTGGGGRYPGGRKRFDTALPIPEVLAGFLAETGPYRPASRTGWRFAPVAGASALFFTGPGAEAHDGALRAGRFQRLEATPEGFLTYRLRL